MKLASSQSTIEGKLSSLSVQMQLGYFFLLAFSTPPLYSQEQLFSLPYSSTFIHHGTMMHEFHLRASTAEGERAITFS